LEEFVIKISNSKLSTWKKCPRWFNNQYVKRIKIDGFVFPALPKGTAFHKLAEWLYVKRVWDLEKMLGMIDAAWKDALTQNKIAPKYMGRQDEYKQEIGEMFKNFYKYLSENNLIGQEARTEQKFGMEWTSPKGIPILVNGYIDRIIILKDRAWITDYKTTKDFPTQEEVDNNMQLTFYCSAYRWMAKNSLNWPKTGDYAELFFPCYPGGAKAITTKRGKEHFELMKEELENCAQAEMNGDNKCTPKDESCKWCPYKCTEHCPETRLGGR
jgi:RecB family exonuclease